MARIGGFADPASAPPFAVPGTFVAQLEQPHVRVYSDGGIRLDGPQGPGFFVGTAYRRSDGYPAVTPDDLAQADPAVLSEEKDVWGDYVLVRAGERGIGLYRSALGRMPCYVAESRGWLLFASDVDLIESARGAGFDPDWQALAHHLAYPHLRRERTCLQGVRELVGGQGLSLASATPEFRMVWSPWDAVPARPTDIEPCAAARSIRRAAIQAIGAATRPFGHILLGVSGGLDSAIVAAGLANFGARTTLVTLVTPDPRGDERNYARVVSAGLGMPLEEHFEIADLVDPCRSRSDHLPRPLARSFAQSGDAIFEAIAARVGADALFTGAGGDNVFCYLQSPAPIADLLLKGSPLRALQCAGDMARITGAGTVEALWRALRRAARRNPNYRWPRDDSFLTADAVADVPREPLHPWLDYPRSRAPGASGHVAAILAIENHLEGHAHEETLPLIAPLMAKPLVEAALRIPAWMWCAGGINRAVARAAFADLLPRAIVERQSKGSPGGFAALIFSRHRHRIREFLCDGVLAAHGIVDRAALAVSLGTESAAHGQHYSRILSLCDVEAWARQRLARSTEG